ncbi:TPA: hypothetical protein QDB16_005263 [Burkholderia vietnamiensis]|nr:hypothetical protein WI97_25390 [Burkholderia vietnamiensis]MBR8282811.1 hypothetical protein [Burkholderia vietnamiensis]QTK83692.1 hypothetical protein J4D21_09860 [Burkholderia vietnamiensis]HDR9318690.1 hypothetical protein [Burkholderia vietnamiensis]
MLAGGYRPARLTTTHLNKRGEIMAAPILPAHPLNGLPLDCELSLVFETEDPFHMPLDRLKVLIESTEPGTEMRGYLFGLYDLRCAVVYARGH